MYVYIMITFKINEKMNEVERMKITVMKCFM